MASGGSLNITEEDPHCTPCVSKGKKVEFYKYCLDCEAHYCAECFELHPRVPFLAKHTVLSKDDEKRWSRIPYKCKTHGRTIEFFCTIHNKLVCQICINLQHRKCELDFIPECSKEISTNRKLTSTVERISKIIETARSYEENFEKKSQTNQYSKQSFLKTLSDFRYSINGMLDGLEQVTTKSMEQRFEDNATYFNASIAELRKLKNELEELKIELTTTSKEKEVLVFIRYTEGIEMVKEAEKKIAELNNKSNKEQFTLVINGKLEQLLKSLKSFGSIIDEQSMASDDGSLSESVVEVLSTKRTLSSSNDNQAGIHISHPSNQSEKESVDTTEDKWSTKDILILDKEEPMEKTKYFITGDRSRSTKKDYYNKEDVEECPFISGDACEIQTHQNENKTGPMEKTKYSIRCDRSRSTKEERCNKDVEECPFISGDACEIETHQNENKTDACEIETHQNENKTEPFEKTMEKTKEEYCNKEESSTNVKPEDIRWFKQRQIEERDGVKEQTKTNNVERDQYEKPSSKNVVVYKQGTALNLRTKKT